MSKKDDFGQEYRKDLKTATRQGPYTVWRMVGCVGIPLILGIFVLGMFARGASILTQPARIVQKTVDADNVIHNYEWFEGQYADFKAINAKITIADGEVETWTSALSEDRAKWSDADRTEFSRLSSIASGLRSQRADIVSEYNARSRMENRALFKSADLPPTLETTP